MIDPVSGIEGVRLVEAAASSQPADLQHLSDRFNSLMAHDPDPAQYSEQHLLNQASPASAWVSAQEQSLQRVSAAVTDFGVQAPHMSMQEVAAREVELNYQLAQVQVQFHAGVYVAQSGKSALQTLMKNQ